MRILGPIIGVVLVASACSSLDGASVAEDVAAEIVVEGERSDAASAPSQPDAASSEDVADPPESLLGSALDDTPANDADTAAVAVGEAPGGVEPSSDASPERRVPVSRGRSLDQARSDAAAYAQAARPIRIRMGSVEIDAPVTDVGVELNGEYEIPGATEVGWYQYGARPGEPGNAVLAAHVDYNGQLGAFFDLRDGAVGDRVEIDLDDGSTLAFEVIERAQFNKSELPFGEIFRRDGPPGLVLITCGGDFNPSIRSYDDNVVLFAAPSL